MKPFAVSGIATMMALVLGACTGTQVPPYGIREGRLPPCADTRTCISTHPEEQEEAAVDPLQYEGTRREGREALAAVIQGFPGARVVSSHRYYLRAEFTGQITRNDEEFFFESDAVIDELEFYFPSDERKIEVRAAARAGLMEHDDARARLEALQELIETYQDQPGVDVLRL